MTYSIFLDAERFPPSCSRFFENSPPIIVRSYDDFMRLIQEYGPPEKVSLDFDLGTPKTGIDCLKSLIAFCTDHNVPLPEFQVSSPKQGRVADWEACRQMWKLIDQACQLEETR